MCAVFFFAAALFAAAPCAMAAGDASPESEKQPTVVDAAVEAIERVAEGENAADVVGETAQAVEDVITEAVVDTVKEAIASVVQDKTLVLRISREFIRKRVPKVVDQTTPVDRCLFGAHVAGEAVTNGQPLVVEGDDPQEPGFTVQFSGSTVTHTRSSKGPVRVYGTGTATYTVQRKIRFDADGFHAEAPSITCDYGSSLDGLGLPPGLRGRLVKRFATPEIQKTRPAADAIAKNDTQQELLTTFTQKTDALVNDLNQRMPWKDTLAIVAPSGAERVRRLTTTPVYVEIRSSVADAEIPSLPSESENLRAPIELLVLGEPGPVVSAELLALWGLSKMAIEPLKDKAEAAAERVSERLEDSARGFEPQLLGEWWVLRLGADLIEQMLGEALDAAADAAPPNAPAEAVPEDASRPAAD